MFVSHFASVHLVECVLSRSSKTGRLEGQEAAGDAGQADSQGGRL